MHEAVHASRWLALPLVVAAACVQACAGRASSPQVPVRCSDAWYRSIEAKVPTSDAQQHGPDIGSDEWKSVVEFKLGVRGKPGVPSRDGDAWCGYVDRLLAEKRPEAEGEAEPRAAAPAQGPSFACDTVETGSIEELVCKDAELSALDRKLAGVYAAAELKATNEHPPVLKAEQRGWIKGRDDCWKSADRRRCVQDEYQLRIAELQARYRLVPSTGPIWFACDGDARNELVATFFQTDPPTLIAERGDSVSLMVLQRSASGARYQGRNESFWENQGEALVTWGYGAPEMRCKRAR